jgi:hypothetical protein
VSMISLLIADICLALHLLLPWTATYMRAFIVFASVFPVLVIRKADLHGTFVRSFSGVNVQ